MRHMLSYSHFDSRIAFNFPKVIIFSQFGNYGSLLENKSAGRTLILFTKALVLGSIEWIRRKREIFHKRRTPLLAYFFKKFPPLYILKYIYIYIYARVSAIIAIRDKVPRVIIYSSKHLGKKYRLRLLSTDLTLIYTLLSTGITAYYNPNGRSNFFTVTCFEIFAAFSISSHTAASSNDEFFPYPLSRPPLSLLSPRCRFIANTYPHLLKFNASRISESRDNRLYFRRYTEVILAKIQRGIPAEGRTRSMPKSVVEVSSSSALLRRRNFRRLGARATAILARVHVSQFLAVRALNDLGIPRFLVSSTRRAYPSGVPKGS